ncbi:membrane-bound lytic murein transglycosylase D precursor [Aquipluma nitroreducens]|uniref:Membrane-bound lytic murein transglycosylase D n=1 Tax=Aquipluma nitroreducens TaxID=2010828 RepID=A0A5K7S393_9BACT|nr:lytic transglycosylase domain-containing protein [Aquipluma nitroreducens]BBE15940.1 membrane-bound lytic murein transglycosylase D precursor [Aquipluma nitroreducens]
MRILKLTVVLLTIAGLNSFASGLRKDNPKKACTINISALDTLSGYEKYYSIPDETMKKIFSDKLDSMLSSWYVQNAFLLDSTELAEADTLKQTLPDSIYIQRLQSMQSAVSLSFNNTVKSFITMYTVRKPKQVAVMLGLANYYFPMFEEALAKYDLPMELKYLPIIESALNPGANSVASAVGLWQFMYSTGKMYKLEISTFVDERRDPLKATDAAARYLRDLYNIYQDWHLVIAAYNCGPGNVNKAIKRSGDAKDYWKIYYRLPKETRGYVPAFIAANYVMNFYQSHNILPKSPDFPIITDTLMVNDYLHFNQISEIIGIPVEQIRCLNPQYRRDIIPASKDKSYSLVLPQDQISAYLENEAIIHDHRRTEFFPNNQIINPQNNFASHGPGDIKGRDKVIYTVKSGDNLGLIAAWFRVRSSDLKYWNNIHKNFIKAGQKLAVYVPEGHGEHYSKLNKKSFSEKQKSLNEKPTVSSTQNLASAAKKQSTETKSAEKTTTQSTVKSSSVEKNNEQTVEKGEFVYYKVRKGDNFWSIAKKFPGVSNDDIMKLNNITQANSLRVGQVLKILPKA